MFCDLISCACKKLQCELNISYKSTCSDAQKTPEQKAESVCPKWIEEMRRAGRKFRCSLLLGNEEGGRIALDTAGIIIICTSRGARTAHTLSRILDLNFYERAPLDNWNVKGRDERSRAIISRLIAALHSQFHAPCKVFKSRAAFMWKL
jgi:hypothetical protein